MPPGWHFAETPRQAGGPPTSGLDAAVPPVSLDVTPWRKIKWNYDWITTRMIGYCESNCAHRSPHAFQRLTACARGACHCLTVRPATQHWLRGRVEEMLWRFSQLLLACSSRGLALANLQSRSVCTMQPAVTAPVENPRSVVPG